MSMELDVKVGRLAYGWSDRQSEKNNWYDPWAHIWRPSPQINKMPTPAFSTDLKEALKLARHIYESEEIIILVYIDQYFLVTMSHPDGTHRECQGDKLPETIVNCYIQIKEEYEHLCQQHNPEIEAFQASAG